MSSRTESQLATSVMQQLNLISADEAPTASDAAYVKGAYEDAYASWQDKGWAYWPVNAIPVLVYRAVTFAVCGEIASGFGIQEPMVSGDDGRPILIGAKGIKDMRRHIARRTSGEPTQYVDY